ncbi:hypothetical protein Y032_0014g2510 [Ancylostoma ceylanicum]|uniref:Uncharacterized protein n=1 Tax=Ancylostoma ceylanicum TaxID=53326 RepID=A0A016VBN6_9BILA|nr:hypothetical protein Y032_0014g2510 [Ancylostoma ceylanicum]
MMTMTLSPSSSQITTDSLTIMTTPLPNPPTFECVLTELSPSEEFLELPTPLKSARLSIAVTSRIIIQKDYRDVHTTSCNRSQFTLGITPFISTNTFVSPFHSPPPLPWFFLPITPISVTTSTSLNTTTTSRIERKSLSATSDRPNTSVSSGFDYG